MKCPCCDQEMEAGFLQTGTRIAWTKKIHKISLLPKKGEVMLENNLFRGVDFHAHICKQCKKVVLDYSDKNYQEV